VTFAIRRFAETLALFALTGKVSPGGVNPQVWRCGVQFGSFHKLARKCIQSQIIVHNGSGVSAVFAGTHARARVWQFVGSIRKLVVVEDVGGEKIGDLRL
jgi:hypothetical protein